MKMFKKIMNQLGKTNVDVWGYSTLSMHNL